MDLEQVMDKVFRFKIGDEVAVKASLPFPGEKDKWALRAVLKVTILERIAQQCHGGVQLKYVGRFTRPCDNVAADFVTLNEFEVCAYPTFPNSLAGDI